MTVLNDNLTVLKELTERLSHPGISGTVHEELIRNQNEIFRLVLDCICEGVVVVDTKEKFLIFNKAAERMFGAGASSSKSKDWSKKYSVFLPDRQTPFPTEDLPLVKANNGEETNNVIMYIQHKHKPEGYWLSVNGRPLLDRLGNIIGAIAVCREIPTQIL